MRKGEIQRMRREKTMQPEEIERQRTKRQLDREIQINRQLDKQVLEHCIGARTEKPETSAKMVLADLVGVRGVQGVGDCYYYRSKTKLVQPLKQEGFCGELLPKRQKLQALLFLSQIYRERLEDASAARLRWKSVAIVIAKMGSDDPSTPNAKATRELGSRDTTTAASVATATTTTTTATRTTFFFSLSLFLSLSLLLHLCLSLPLSPAITMHLSV